MALDPRFTPARGLQEFLIDKTTGLPLSSGTVTFYQDINRTQLKNVYEISGTPPNYQYNPLPNPLTLSGVGTMVDANGNDVLPYYFPYDGTPITTTNTVDLYYIVVKSAASVTQFTREGFPNTVDTTSNSIDITNYVDNGQFVTHNDMAKNTTPSSTFNYGIYNNTVYPVAPGGWTFERSTGSTATDNISWVRNTAFSQIPSQSPRYAIRMQRTNGSNDNVCDLRLKFRDVNKFSGQALNLYFTALSNTGTLNNVQVVLIYYFGSGGSTTLDLPQAAFTLTNSYQQQFITIPFDALVGYTVDSTADDDFLQIAFRMPTSSGGLFDVQFTNTILTPSLDIPLNVLEFPPTTTSEFLTGSLFGSISVPAYDNSNLYLPIRMTPTGFAFDSSEVGNIVAKSTTANFTNSISTVSNELLCDGNTYLASGYSSLGIPYSRLFNVLYNSTASVPIYGTGSAFVTTSTLAANTAYLFYIGNLFGTATAPNNGAISPGFTFTQIAAASAGGYNCEAYADSSGKLLIVGTVVNSAPTTAPNGSTFTSTAGGVITLLKNVSNNYVQFMIDCTGVTVANLVSGGNSTSFTYSIGSNNYIVYFTLNGSGTPPTSSATKIAVNVQSTYTVADVAKAIVGAVMGGNVYQIEVVAGNSITANSYWTFSTPNGNSYYVWYNKGGGTDPSLGGYTLGIPVSINSSYSTAQVVAATLAAVNSAYFATPNLHGVSLRGYDPNANWDVDGSTRFSYALNTFGAVLGTFEVDQITAHTHALTIHGSVPTALLGNTLPLLSAVGWQGGPAGGADIIAQGTYSAALSGGTETRPVNMYVNYVIKY